ncbi:MAG: TRAP transporter small permease subunit [Pseudomonadota bacterium]
METPAPRDVRGGGPLRSVLAGIVWIGRAAAWLIVPILALVLASVTLSALKVGMLAEWEGDAFLFGSKLTLASLGDLQWHLFGAMLMLTMAGALVTDNHVRVDFLRQHMGERSKAVVDLVGHLVLTLPFTCIVAWHGFDFVGRSFAMGEGSDYDGLYDRFVVKAFLPAGFVLMTLAAMGLAADRALFLLRGEAR